jgi:hypothetical protein
LSEVAKRLRAPSSSRTRISGSGGHTPQFARHFTHALKERIVGDVGYELSLEARPRRTS